MALLVVAVLFLAITGHSDAAWCACKDGLSESVLQKTLDYACGAGADCNPIKQNGACYNPNTVKAHCSYAVNSYFQKKGQAAGSCDFAGTATVTASNPSSSSLCVYPTSASSTGTTTTATPTPVTTTPTTTGTPSTTTTAAPFTATPTGVIGDGSTANTGINDVSQGGVNMDGLVSLSMTLLLSSLMVWLV